MAQKVLSLGCDHAGFDYKVPVSNLLKEMGYSIDDKGTDSPDSVDYPDFVHPVAESIQNGDAELGILMCGSGNGVSMTANKHKGIRAALCWNKELAALAKQHNNANILSIPVRFVSEDVALEMVRTFLETEFEGGRHARRVDKIDC